MYMFILNTKLSLILLVVVVRGGGGRVVVVAETKKVIESIILPIPYRIPVYA